ncbi:MAG TPA: DNA-processing protein DprA [Cyclobacteriaceae bacterium]|nr:DNA-processing protein DprA [Cyclobacteriaceae bacterium]
MDQTRLSLLALHFIPGLGDYLIRQLVSYCGTAESVFKTPKGKLLRIPGIGDVTADAIVHGKPFAKAEEECKKAERQNVQLLFFIDKTYPKRLRAIDDAPTLLYAKGTIDFENPKAVGIVGTRRATDYGKQCIEELIQGLVPHNTLIVSGLAYGIDIHAHKQALHHNLPTIGVLGSGIDVIYPAVHGDVANKMQRNGGLVTENSFGTKPDAHNFPQRNRIIAALSDALVVIEAGETGGALITAEISNSYNKDVFAFPGNIGQSYSQGCNNLIKANKANLITSAKDLEYMMNWDVESKPQQKAFVDMEGYGDSEKSVLTTLLDHGGVLFIDELSWKTNISVSTLASILLNLEFRGAVQSLPGKKYKVSKVN